MKDKNRIIVDYIALEWAAKAQSQSAFASEHNIDEKTVRNIKYNKGYNISLKTLIRICEAREIKLSDFFKLLDL
ncbi:helix-turn-helix domain-containing protein [Flavobacterium bizetiae]|uniref:helix-turn-helix domain-containing protein n=1 Tax=Flavobacterium bizetiae TaxID=2704140 RepID=UPI0037582BFD